MDEREQKKYSMIFNIKSGFKKKPLGKTGKEGKSLHRIEGVLKSCLMGKHLKHSLHNQGKIRSPTITASTSVREVNRAR